ncbi:MAG: RagB/SusD family nutrient uptake outer membrane protein [Bacteroidota bacterium]|nr:RagB/SusD family nutrient uptake outer membrane protein [Bacteroidota bacterium]
MKKIFTKYSFIFLFIASMLTGCESILNQEPENAVTNGNLWQTENDVDKICNGLHNAMSGAYGGIQNWFYGEVHAQSFDAMTNWAWTSIFSNDLDAIYGMYDSWGNEYKVISFSNLLIDNLHRVDMTQDRRDYYEGIARFCRAYSYLYILKAWGEAPLVTSSIDVSEKSKVSQDVLGEFIITEAEKARLLLKPYSQERDMKGSPLVTKQIPSQGAADALLADAYAWIGTMKNDQTLLKKSVEAATRVISSPEYALVASPEEVCQKVLLGNSKEGIFEIEYNNSTQVASQAAHLACFTESWPVIRNEAPGDIKRWDKQVVINSSSVNKIFDDPNDLRRTSYFYKPDSMATVSTATTGGRAYLYKWRHPVLSTDGLNTLKGFEDNIILYRLADVILLRAEINNRLGNTDLALADLKTIRDRAKATSYSAAEGDLKLVILKERYKELYLEGNRFWDLARNGELRNMVPSFSGLTDQDVADGALYWPVSPGAFSKNPLMRQNTYWKKQGIN